MQLHEMELKFCARVHAQVETLSKLRGYENEANDTAKMEEKEREGEVQSET
jgi:hypothetical protein